ncbi:MAG TPA: glycosyltransferase family 39 protein [Thermomicrobiales bacterium]
MTTLLALALLGLMGVTMLTTIARKGLTNDEVVHIPAGYIALTTGDFRPNNEQPPLPKLLAAVPLLPLRLTVPPPATAPWDDPSARSTARALAFWDANAAQFAAISFWARVPAIGLTLALGWLIFAYGRGLLGARAGLLALALYALEPTILAHGRVVHTDLPAAFGFFLGVIATHHYLRAPSLLRAATLGAVTGVALLTKFSLLVFAPVPLLALLVVAVRGRSAQGWRAFAGHAALVGLVALLVVNVAYGVAWQPLGADDRAWIAGTPPSLPRAVLLGPSPVTILLPTDFLYGLYYQYLHDRQGHPASLLGEVSTEGWWFYFPVAFALKATLPFLALSLGGILWGLWRIGRRDRRFVALLLPLALFVALALNSRINIGIRHFLPAYPFLCLLGAALLDRACELQPARWLGRLRWLPRVGVAALLGWTALTAAFSYPNYLPYMNAFAAGRPGWQLLGDSNLEWGDDVPALAAYLRAHGETEVTAAVSAGWATLPRYGIAYHPLFAYPTEEEVPTRYVAIGASFLAGATVPPAVRDHFLTVYRDRTPEATFGGTIFLYRARAALPPLAAPLPPSSFRATVTALDPPATLIAGQSVEVRVRVRNDSDIPWPVAPPESGPYAIHLGNRWFDTRSGRPVRDDARASLPYALYPDEEVTLPLTITAPPAGGLYTLDIDLVQEGVAWSGALGGSPTRMLVQVQP